MDIAVLGTGRVGRAIAGRLAELGHDVVVGTRDPEITLGRTEPDSMGYPPFAQWHREHVAVRLLPFAEVGRHTELLVNATAGMGSLDALRAVGADGLAGVVILDVANPLDSSGGFPPALSVVNTDSLTEQIQREFPESRVVKTLNTVTAAVMVDPARVPGDHDIFVCGDDDVAKQTARGLLREFGWRDSCIIDLGGIRAARGAEMYLPLWISLMQTLGTADFNIKVVR